MINVIESSAENRDNPTILFVEDPSEQCCLFELNVIRVLNLFLLLHVLVDAFEVRSEVLSFSSVSVESRVVCDVLSDRVACHCKHRMVGVRALRWLVLQASCCVLTAVYCVAPDSLLPAEPFAIQVAFTFLGDVNQLECGAISRNQVLDARVLVQDFNRRSSCYNLYHVPEYTFTALVLINAIE